MKLSLYRKSRLSLLLEDTSDKTRGDGTTTLTDVESLTGFGGNGTVCLQDHLDVVTGHDLLGLVVTGEAESSSLIYNTLAKNCYVE
jgi:hypothetical protein